MEKKIRHLAWFVLHKAQTMLHPNDSSADGELMVMVIVMVSDWIK